jgi:AraC-like DNA-binding protein
MVTPTTTLPLVPLSVMCGYFTNKIEGEVLLRKGLPEWHFILTLRGRGWLRDAGQQVVMEPGDLVAYRPHTPQHYGHARRPAWKMAWMRVFPRAECLDWLAWPELMPGVLRLRLEPEVLAAVAAEFAEMFRLQEDRSLLYRLDRVTNQMEKLLLVCGEANPVRSRPKKGDPRLAPAIEHLSRRYTENASLETLASECGLSRALFARLFVERTGKTPHAFLERQRIDQACYLLHETDLPVAEVAEQAGFPSQYYFARRFTKLTGTSPSTYRTQAKARSAPTEAKR